MKKFSENHHWVKIINKLAEIGLTKEVLQYFGRISFISLPEIGKIIKKDEGVCIIESTKCAYDITSPLSGKVIAVNEKIIDNVKLLSHEEWLFKIELSSSNELDGLI